MTSELEIKNQAIDIDFKAFTSLKKLEISNPKNKIPAEIAVLNTLEELSLSGISQVPEEIFQLTSLTSLTLQGKMSDNTFSKPYPDLFENLLNLETLTLGMASGEFPESVFKLPKLKNLAITIENCETLKNKGLNKLCQTEQLTIVSNHFPDGLFEEIATLTSLQELTLDVINVNKFPFRSDMSALGKSLGLKKLQILNAQLPSLPATFQNLKSLRHFHLEATSLRRFDTALEGYFENLPDTLQTIYIDCLGFSHLPESISRFIHLRDLYLTSKSNTEGYENLLLIPDCEKIYLRFYQPKDENQLIEYIILEKDTKTKYSDLVGYFKQNRLGFQEQKNILLLAYKTNNTNFDKETLLKLLGFPKAVVREQAFTRLIKMIENPFESPDFDKDKAVIGIAGKIKQRKTADLKENLLRQGYRFSTFPDNNITHLVITQDDIKNTDELLNPGYKLALPEHLIALIEKEDKPYLKSEDAVLGENVINLLYAEDENSKMLALQMMLEGGIPETRFTEFVICFLIKEYKNSETKGAFRRVVEKHCTAVWFVFFKTFARLSLHEDYSDKVLNHELIEKEDFLKTGLIVGYRKSKKWFTHFLTKIHKYQPELLADAMQYLVRENLLDLRQAGHWEYSERENLAKVLSWQVWDTSKLSQIEIVELWAYEFSLTDTHFLKNLKLLPKLAEIRIFTAPVLTKNAPKPDKAIALFGEELASVRITLI